MNRLKRVCPAASLAFLLAATAAVGFVLLAIGFVELYDELARMNRTPQPGYGESLAVTDGRPVIARQQWWPVRGAQAFDLQHQPVELPPDATLRQFADLPAEPPRQGNRLRWLRRTHRVQRIATVGRGENWYRVFDGNRSNGYYFQGLAVDGGQTVGYIGRDGFQPTKPDRDAQFVESPRFRTEMERIVSERIDSRVVLVDDRHLLLIDFANRTVQRLIDEPIVSIDRLNRDASGSWKTREHARRAVRTAGRVVVLSFDGGPRRTFVIPEELRRQRFKFFPLDEGALYSAERTQGFPKSLGSEGGRPSSDNADVRTQDRELVWATASGKVTRRTSVELSSSRPRDNGMSREGQLRCVVVAVPATIWSAGFAFGVIPWLNTQAEDDIAFPQTLRESAGDSWWVVALVAGLSGWLARLTFQHQRSQGEPDGWFWAVFVFLLGVPGYVGYRLHRSWPHSEPIPASEPTGWEVFAS